MVKSDLVLGMIGVFLDVSRSFSETLCVSQVPLWKEPRKSKGVPLEEEVRESMEKERFVERSNQEELLTYK